ncbi:MAG: hypothetical protein HYS21_10060 [Deltaproteobacteria bacterium]|nr:hypothetical protein [Deltaproteobacteria bacterium]
MAIEVNFKKTYIVNGKEYHSLEAMPADVRRSYEELMKAVGLEKLSSASDLGKSLKSPEMKTPNPQLKALTFEASFSPRSLIIIAALIIFALVAYLYF